MPLYEEFLAELKSYADEDYKAFHKKLLKNDNINVLGVRVPLLRKIAKKYKNCVEALFAFPDEFYEVTFVKLTAVSYLDYDDFLKYADKCVNILDNWATCDCFTPKCIATHKQEFLPYIKRYILTDGEFIQRFALKTLLSFYVEPFYAEEIFLAVERCNTNYYYVHMAAAWLIAETLAKMYGSGSSFLMEQSLDKKTHNKAIQKACESYRLSNDRKNFLKGLKR